ncbi:MAG TPA: hypothetical protein VN449_08495 [Gaiellaceae bacterium]|nr:hypothetical protein [Gaiellaceae bacterium]
MDRLTIARAERRRQATDELEFERERATALQEQLERIVLELEGPAVDEEVFAKMAPEDVDLIRAAIQGGSEMEVEDIDDELLDGDEGGHDTEQWAAEQREAQEAEIVRLQAEIASSERRQQALGRYLEALGA